MPGTPLVFNSNSLQTNKIFISSIKYVTNKNAPLYALAHANQSVIPNTEFPSKLVQVTGQVIGDDISDTDEAIDNLYTILSAENAPLDVGWKTGLRRYTATPGEPDIDRPGGLMFANFAVVFVCTMPFGQDITPTTVVSATGRTVANYSDFYTFLGNAPFQLPIFTYTFTAVAGSGVRTVVIGNNNTGQSITVTRVWASGDVLQINTITSVVTVNGFQVEFTGAFPTFKPGAQSIGYADTFTSRTFNIDITYNVMYK